MPDRGGPEVPTQALPLWVEDCARRLERLADETRPAHPRVAELLEVEARRLRGMDVDVVELAP